jgi:hypothetical protein
MCIFSRHVEHVSATKIFARGLPDGRQVLIYAMDVAMAEDLAMVLPLPVPANGADDAVEFVSLEAYPALFDDLKNAFPRAVPALGPGAFGLEKSLAIPLAVHTVGAFEASFVPHPRDFARLDARFRLPGRVLDAVPTYADWGFAVFQLRAAREGTTIHPMALRFPRRDPRAVFFPTVHVHDGSVLERAVFDHALYAQDVEVDRRWTASLGPLGAFVAHERAGGLVAGDAPGVVMEIHGAHPNRDVWLRAQ